MLKNPMLSFSAVGKHEADTQEMTPVVAKRIREIKIEIDNMLADNPRSLLNGEKHLVSFLLRR